MLFFLFFMVNIPCIQSENCTLCSNATHEPLAGESASFMLPSGFISCANASELAAQGSFSNCTALHTIAEQICQCGDPSEEKEPFQCPLCGEGQVLPLPDRLIASKTCQEWEDIAANDFEMDCTSYQKSFGSYCGCDISSDVNHFDGFCRICNDTLLPDPNKKVTFERTEGDQKVQYTRYCVELEQDFNSMLNLDCDGTQKLYSQEGLCDCGYDIDVPTRQPSSDDDEGVTSSARGLKLFQNNRKMYSLVTGIILLL